MPGETWWLILDILARAGALLATARTPFFVFAFVALLALGMAFIAPNLAALISKRGGEQQAGASLGVQNAANSLGQAGGPLLGGLLFIWQINAPYLFSGAVLLALALVIGWKAMERQREARLACDEGGDHDNRNRLGS